VTGSIRLYWIPLGADGSVVRHCGGLWERLAARRERRAPAPLYHAAMLVDDGSTTYAVELAPAWGPGSGDAGVIATGPVGLAAAGRCRWLRYEIRMTPGGTIPDLHAAVGEPVAFAATSEEIRAFLALGAEIPAATWGRDEARAGDMWNSNSVISWLLVRAGLPAGTLTPPAGGRAPGWDAGIRVAAAAAAAERSGS
jgi:hypothetical protein